MGQARFDVNPVEKSAVVGISLTESARGRGLGAFILNKSMEELAGRRHDVNTVSAYIKEGNIASIKSFEKAGFTFLRETTVKGSKAKVYEKSLGYEQHS